MPRRVLLATFCLCPDGEPGGHLLVDALAERGVDAAWASWDDPTVDWAAADLVAVRATWDYHRRFEPFLAWAREVESVTPLLNSAATFEWNADKAYLQELADAGVPVVPSELVADEDLLGGLRRALERWPQIVVKPRVGAGGVGVVVADSVEDERLAGLTSGPWLAQPLVESVRTVGEVSVFVLDGRAVVRVDKHPGAGEIRVHEQYGGVSVAVPLGSAGGLAERVVSVAGEQLGRPLDYARVDLMELDGDLVVSELELIEPGLYLDVAPQTAGPFADLVAARLP